jgi:hypothetical protein
MPDVQVVPRINASKNAESPPLNSNCRETESSAQCERIDARITRYGARYWAVYVNDELLVVTVYKKGAIAVQNALMHS